MRQQGERETTSQKLEIEPTNSAVPRYGDHTAMLIHGATISNITFSENLNSR